MKRHLFFSALIASGLLVGGGAHAQDPVTAAEREQAEDRYRTMNTRLMELGEVVQSFQKRINDLRE
ncbi:MAG TPA: hypothetical protein VGJ22_15045, partial [Anaerolineales bacterium]